MAPAELAHVPDELVPAARPETASVEITSDMKQELVDRILARTNVRANNLVNNTALFTIFRKMDRKGLGELTYEELGSGLRDGGLGLAWTDSQVKLLCKVRCCRGTTRLRGTRVVNSHQGTHTRTHTHTHPLTRALALRGAPLIGKYTS